MNVVLFSTLYPNTKFNRHGVFVENRLRHLLCQNEDIKVKVVAPVPWFPFSGEIFGEYGKFSGVPKKDTRFGVEIYHPRYLLVPKIGMIMAPFLMMVSMITALSKIRKNFDFDLIDAHYYYPDGVAATMLAKYFKKPVVITARGTDINLIPKYTIPRAMIRWAATNASRSIVVCKALKDEMVRMGADGEKIVVLRNGVDLKLFKPINNRLELRATLGISGKLLLSVGHLIERKGNHLIIEALMQLPEFCLIIAGDGPEEKSLYELADKLCLTDRVTFVGALSQSELQKYYCAADALVLASSREGWANVLLESMACGTPVVATKVWGTPEVVTNAAAGVLVDERTADSLADSINILFSNYPDRADTRNYAEKFGWHETSSGQMEVFKSILNEYKQ